MDLAVITQEDTVQDEIFVFSLSQHDTHKDLLGCWKVLFMQLLSFTLEKASNAPNSNSSLYSCIVMAHPIKVGRFKHFNHEKYPLWWIGGRCRAFC